jgi:hypothetical protein
LRPVAPPEPVQWSGQLEATYGQNRQLA